MALVLSMMKLQIPTRRWLHSGFHSPQKMSGFALPIELDRTGGSLEKLWLWLENLGIPIIISVIRSLIGCFTSEGIY